MTKQTKKSTASEINDAATYTGAVRSTFSSVNDGARIITSGANQLLKTTNEAMKHTRIETFEMAMGRLRVDMEDLPLIHNQIVVQVYMAFLLSVVAITVGVMHFVVGSEITSFVLSVVIGLTALIFAIQSSLQTYQIRRQKLNLLSEWFSNSGEWFPSRIDGLKLMEKRDPLRSPKVVGSLVTFSRFFSVLGLLFLAISAGLVGFGPKGIENTWGLLLAAFGLFGVISGARYSFEVFRRRIGIHCDLGAWMVSPKDWFPSKEDPRTDDLKKYFTADGKLNVENSAQAVESPEEADI